jgi:hypothetical protein
VREVRWLVIDNQTGEVLLETSDLKRAIACKRAHRDARIENSLGATVAR